VTEDMKACALEPKKKIIKSLTYSLELAALIYVDSLAICIGMHIA
jgi:hypothetical protein